MSTSVCSARGFRRKASAPASRARPAAARMLKTSTAISRVSGVRLEPAAEREPVERGDEDLRDDDVRDDLPSLLQGAISVLLEPDGVTGLMQEVRLELADVRIAIDDQDDRLSLSSEHRLIRPCPRMLVHMWQTHQRVPAAGSVGGERTTTMG